MEDFDSFAARHVDDLLRTAYLITWDDHEAEDLVQECLFKVARRWSRVRRMELPLAYARRILINLALDGGRRRSRRRVELSREIPAVDAVAGPMAGYEERVELFDALAELSVEQRTVLVLRYFNDLTEAEIAEAVGCSVGTVKSRTSRGLERLRTALRPIALEQGEESHER